MEQQSNPAATAAAAATRLQQQPQPKTDGTEKAAIPPKLFVLDTTATDKSGPRKHEMIVEGRVRQYIFQPHQPLELPFPVAIKFLKIEAFLRTDEKGEVMPYQRQPKQPHELGAGQKFVLQDHQTIADYKELSNMALYQRALELPGGENVEQKREAMIDFIVRTTVQMRKANEEKLPGKGKVGKEKPADDDDVETGEIDAIPESEAV